MTPLLEKGVFDMGEKVGFTNCVFEKLCFFYENAIFIVFQKKTKQRQKLAIQTLYVNKNRKLMKNSGLFLNMAEGCFFSLFLFSGFNVIVFFSW